MLQGLAGENWFLQLEGTLRKDLSYEPEWYEDGTLTWDEPQDAEAVQMFLRAQEKAVLHWCGHWRGWAHRYSNIWAQLPPCAISWPWQMPLTARALASTYGLRRTEVWLLVIF